MVCAMTAFAGGDTISGFILLKSGADDEAMDTSCGKLGKAKDRVLGEYGKDEYRATGS